VSYPSVVDPAALDELIDLAYDFLLTRRVNELVDIERVLAGLDALAEPGRAMRFIQRFVAPGRTRLFSRLSASTVKLGAWLPDPVRDAIAAELGKPVRIPRHLVEEAVANPRVKESVRTMMQEAVTGVIDRAFEAAPAGTGRGLRGMMSLGARATRGVFGGIADEVQRQLEERVKDVVDSGVGLVQRRIVEKMTSEETARQMGERRRAMFLKLLEKDEPVVGKFLAGGRHDLLDALAPVLGAHNLARAEVRKHLADEVGAVLAELSTQTLGELLGEAGLREIIREGLHRQLPPLLAEFAATPAVLAWRAKLT
jgi:hypothetical protein